MEKKEIIAGIEFTTVSASIDEQTVGASIDEHTVGFVDRALWEQLKVKYDTLLTIYNDIVDIQAKLNALSGVETNAQVNIIETVQQNGVDLAVANKKVNIDISGKVDKVEGKELSTNDYTDLEQAKLGTIEENAEVNIIEVVKDSDSTPLEVASEDRSVTLTKSVVGLGNVDNTSDVNKPVSTAQGAALDTKPSIATFDGATGTVSFYKETVLVGDETPLFTVDLPTEALVVSGAYDAETEIITLTLANGSTIEIDASGLINANELVDAIATKLGLDFSALNAMGAIDTANDLIAVRDVSGTAKTKKVAVKTLVESAGVMKDISQLGDATIDDTDYMLVGESGTPKKATIGALKNHLKTPVSIDTTNTERIESTYGSFVPHTNGIPMVKEIQGLTVDSEQLVTNGDFSNGTTGWGTQDATHSVIGGILSNKAIGTSNYGRSFNATGKTILTNDKIYTKVRVRVLNSLANSISTYIRVSTSGTVLDTNIKLTPIINQWYDLSSVLSSTFNSSNLHFWVSQNYSNNIDANNSILEVDYAYAFNISNLIANKQYSPLYNTTFDLMSDEQIKAQMDLWVQDNTLPHALQSVTNTTIKSVGKNLFDKYAYETDYALKIHVKPSQAYVWGVSTAYKLYDSDNLEIASGTATSVTTTASTKYIAFSGIADIDTFQLEQGSTATAYEPYVTETQVFNATIRSATNDGTIRDKIRYDNGRYVIDRYVDSATGLALATPLLANETVDVDGTLLQDSVTTLIQEQDLSTVYKVEWSMNTEQSVVTLVQRDKMQQEEIDDLENKMATAQGDIVTLDGEAVKTVQLGDNPAMTPTANKITIPLAVPTGEGQTDGILTHEDKAKIDTIDNKVDKVEGETLTPNKYTDGEKAILNYIGSTVEQELVVIDADDIKSLSLTDGDETSTVTVGNSMGIVEVGDDDNIYVSNTIIGTPNEDQVKKLNRNYEEQFTISLGFSDIHAMAVFGGYVYIAYTVFSGPNIIKRYSIVDGAEDTTYTHSTHYIGAMETATVKRMKFDKEGNLFYTCTGSGSTPTTLVKLDSSGKELLRVRNGMGSSGLAIDSEGNAIYSAGVYYTSYNKIFKVNGKTGASIWTSADLGGSSEEIVVDSNDDIILSSRFMATAFVKKLSKVDGSVLWTASGFSNYTNKVTIDADDNVYTRDGYDVIKLSKTDGAELWSVTLLGEVRDIAMLSLKAYKKLDFIDATKDMVKPISIATSQVLEKVGMELPTDFKLYPYTFYYQTLTANYEVASLEEYENIYLRKWHFGVANASVAYSVSFVPTIKWETALPTFAINTIYEFEIIKVGTVYIGKWHSYA